MSVDFSRSFEMFWGASPPNPRLDFSLNRVRKVEGKEPYQIFQSYLQIVDLWKDTKNRYIRFLSTALHINGL